MLIGFFFSVVTQVLSQADSYIFNASKEKNFLDELSI